LTHGFKCEVNEFLRDAAGIAVCVLEVHNHGDVIRFEQDSDKGNLRRLLPPRIAKSRGVWEALGLLLDQRLKIGDESVDLAQILSSTLFRL
jgi:hypothetical protein